MDAIRWASRRTRPELRRPAPGDRCPPWERGRKADPRPIERCGRRARAPGLSAFSLTAVDRCRPRGPCSTDVRWRSREDVLRYREAYEDGVDDSLAGGVPSATCSRPGPCPGRGAAAQVRSRARVAWSLCHAQLCRRLYQALREAGIGTSWCWRAASARIRLRYLVEMGLMSRLAPRVRRAGRSRGRRARGAWSRRRTTQLAACSRSPGIVTGGREVPGSGR
jgi:hypothetical protein